MQENEITDEYDKEFISLMLTIEKRSEILNKYDKLRIKNWCKKLCQITNNIEWKKNRNLHAICILDCILNNHFDPPYNKFPSEGSIPLINKTLVKSKLSKKFFLNTNVLIENIKEVDKKIIEEKEQIEKNNVIIKFNNKIKPQKEYKKKNFINHKNATLMKKILNNNLFKVKKNNKPLTEEQKLKLEVSKLKQILVQKENDIIKTKEDISKLENKRDELQKTLAIFLQMGNKFS